ncbi:hypothetical protein ACSBR2_004888 [Camellia fascicularis]
MCRYESKFIQIIVQEIVSKLDFTVLSVTPYQTGIDSHVKDINMWFQGGLNNVSVMVICGMGGIGKTTIAKIVYNQNFDKFEGSSFLAKIRETVKQPNGLVCLQRQLVSDILKWNKERIYCVAEGINKIKDAMCYKRVLVVLDDVDDLNQADEVYKSYVVKELNDDEALCLFSRHAFGQDKPIEAYMEHSKREASEAGTTYKTHEQRLVDYISFRIPEDSFSNIKNCIGIARGFMHDLSSVKKGNASLEAVLLSVSDGYHCMDLCLYIESQIVLLLNESTTSSESSSNGCKMIVQASDLPFVSISRSTGLNQWNLYELKMENEKVWNIPHSVVAPLAVSAKSASGAQSQNEDFVAEHAMFNEGNSLKRRRRGLFSFLCVIPTFIESFSESDEDDLKTDACSQMHTSRLLQLNNVRLSGGYQKFPKKLRWFCWHGFPLKSIPNDFTLDSLFALEMQNSSLEQLWKRTKLPNLERLILKYFINLVGIHESIGELGTLVLLNLEGCKNLRKLPKKVFLVKSLELILSGCSILDRLPPDLGKDGIIQSASCRWNKLITHLIIGWFKLRVLSGANVVGKSKGLQWMYMPAFIGKILNQLMEDDDEVDVSVDPEEAFRVKELGIRVLM